MRLLASRLAIDTMLRTMGLLRRIDHHVNGSAALRGDDDFRQDPYPSYEFMRPRGPIVRSFANQGWIVVGFAAAQDALHHPGLSSRINTDNFVMRLLSLAAEGEPIPFTENPPMLSRDPPDHTRLRKLATPGFTHRYVQALEPVIARYVDELLDNVGNHREFDVISSLAEPLPAWVITKMLGTPDAERPRFLKWSHELIGATMITSPDRVARAARTEQEMYTYFARLVAEKQASPGDDFISRLVHAEVEHDHLTRDEVIATCILLLAAGHETTTRLIGNGLMTLLRHPEQMARLRADRSRIAPAIEEMLRFEPPVQMTLRFVKEHLDFHGHRFRAGQMVLINFAAANRDPAVNPNPNEFDINRAEVRHLSFGHGFHLCLGLSLARLEARVAFNALLDRYPEIRHADKAAPAWENGGFFRGLEHLRIAV